MSEAASSINPNVPVGAEASTASKANSAITFDDVADAPGQQKSKPKLVKEEKPAAESKVRGNNKEDRTSFDEADDDTPKAKTEAEPKAKQEGPKASKPKIHKIRAGESMIDIPGDAEIEVPVNGKLEKMTFEEFRSQVSGKINWDKKNNEFHREKTEFSKQRDSLNNLVKNLYEKASQDPDAAFDFLAELTKQDAVKLKGEILRKQFEQMKPLFEMSEQERDAWFKDRERDWRDQAHESRTRADSEREAQAAEEAKRTEASEKYGIDGEAWTFATKAAHQVLSKADPKFDGKVSPEQVVQVNRHIMALEVIGQTVPNLENHKNFDSIVEDIVHDLVRHPGVTREKLASLLQEIWGDENKGLKNLARKAAKNAQISEDERPARNVDRKVPLTFDDLD